jgi:hypothetical protein
MALWTRTDNLSFYNYISNLVPYTNNDSKEFPRSFMYHNWMVWGGFCTPWYDNLMIIFKVVAP